MSQEIMVGPYRAESNDEVVTLAIMGDLKV